MKRLFGILFVILLILSSCATVKQEKEISQTTTIECNSDSQDFKSQSTLSHIALNDRDSEVRKLAIKKLTTQSTLSHVALNDKDSEVRKLAIKKLTTQSTLSHVALNDSDVEIRKLAISKLTTQSTLSHVALNDKDSEVRKLAIKKLTIQSTLSCFSPLYFRTRLVTENTNFEYDTN